MLEGSLDMFEEHLQALKTVLEKPGDAKISQVKEKVQDISALAEYLGASRIFYQSHFMALCCQQKRLQRALDYYQGLIEAIIEWRVYANREYQLNLDKEAKSIKEPSLENIPVYR